jgi:hypothetical protein
MTTTTRPLSRADRIAQALDRSPAVRSWYSQTQMPGRRWIVETALGYDRRFTTAQVEVFLFGLRLGEGIL